MNSHWARGLAFASGAAVAVVATRLLPPFVARAAGRTMGGRDPFQSLARDHRTLLQMLTGMEQSPRHKLDRAQRFFRFKRKLAAHAMAEEDVIYPLLAERTEEAAARQLYSEHADMKMLLYALEQMPKDSPGWTDKVRELKELIERHARQEEEVEFPRLRAMLDGHAKALLAGSISQEKSMVL